MERRKMDIIDVCKCINFIEKIPELQWRKDKLMAELYGMQVFPKALDKTSYGSSRVEKIGIELAAIETRYDILREALKEVRGNKVEFLKKIIELVRTDRGRKQIEYILLEFDWDKWTGTLEQHNIRAFFEKLSQKLQAL